MSGTGAAHGNRPHEPVSSPKRSVIETDGAPQAIGPYSQAVRIGQMLFTSGQIGLVPGEGRLIDGGVAAEATQVLANIKAILDAAGATTGDVVKTTVYLVDMADFPKVNEVYGRAFGPAPPARSTVAVASLPMGARVAIDAIAVESS